MHRLKGIILLSTLLIVLTDTFAQSGEWPIEIFGYFQSKFQYQTIREDEPEQTSFSLQQLNLFFQKELAQHWTAFVNFEILNNFSSSRQTGAINLEEAWLRYSSSEKFNLKLGLLLPIFNNLNEIKNRTPLLPYITRPLIYETSFGEIVEVEEFLPARAFVQTYGFITFGQAKLDYAFYVGNSPNIDNESDRRLITGIDTTDTFLAGGRVGVRFKELKFGLSATHDKTNRFQGFELFFGGPPSRFIEVPRIRFGGDLSYNLGQFSFEGEFVTLTYDEDAAELDFDKKFFYGTLGYHITERLFAYGSNSLGSLISRQIQ